MRLDSPVTSLAGVGKARAASLFNAGIITVRDLLYTFPRAYENRGDTRLLGEHLTSTASAYILTVASEVSVAKLKNRMTMSKLRAFDDSGSVEIVFFNSPFVKDIFHIGDVFRFYGRASFSKTKRLNLVNPKYEPVVSGTPLPDFVPIYPSSENVGSKLISRLVQSVLAECAHDIVDYLPESIRIGHSLPTLSYALHNIHLPESREALARAQRRLAFDELLLFAMGIAKAGQERVLTRGVSFKPTSIKPLTDILEFELTDSQKNAINDIYRDLVIRKENGYTPAMARILVGDVGCGKTICALASMYFAAKSGFQSALMVPTEILAVQHYEDACELLSRLDIRVALLTGSTTAKNKREIYEAIEAGEIDVVIGTHALLNDKINFKSLGLIVTDEQHRFGVAQRASLKNKSEGAHMLVMSATPIPRTMALAMYGDLDISRITEMPKGRQRVDTFLVDEGYRARLNEFIRKQVAAGGQCYIICPSIESEEEDDDYLLPEGFGSEALVKKSTLNLKSAVEYAEDLKKALKGLRIACLHGKMKSSEKDEIMSEFSAGKIDVLVSTTVIEVGVNVPNASLMVVENAERFGLSQLHQLRGRVGRGKRKSYCVLVSDAKNDKSMARLTTMKTTYDGFEIASKDLALRGPGDFFSMNKGDNLRQSGGFEFKLASICDEPDLFELAFSTAKSIIKIDPELKLSEHRLLGEMLDSIVKPSSTIS